MSLIRALSCAVVSVVVCACGASPAPEVPVAEQADAGAPCPAGSTSDVVATNSYGAMHGTLQIPAGCGPFASVVIIPGSGPTDRNGNSVGDKSGPDAYRLLAAGLAERGVASLRYDKAGIAASVAAGPKREDDMLFEMGADDAALWVTRLRTEARIKSVTLVGHSEGSLLAILAAKRVKVDGYVSLAGAGRPIGVILREQLAKNIKDATLLASANDIITKLEHGEMVPASEVPDALSSLFRQSVQPYLISWMKIDPIKEIAGVSGPILLVQGTTDVQVAVVDAKLLAAARPDAKLAMIEGMNHVLKEATNASASQNKAYTDPSLPIAPGLWAALEPLFAPPH